MTETRTAKQRIGLIGAGLMGHGIGRNILKHDYPLTVLVHRNRKPVEDLTSRRVEVNPLTGGYPTGSWGDESRDYHVSVRLAAKAIGQEQLAARVQLAVNDQMVAQSLVKARWSDDEGLTTRINPEVAHYTGQTELAEAIQEGLAAKAGGDDETATKKLGRAVQLAAETGNERLMIVLTDCPSNRSEVPKSKWRTIPHIVFPYC